MEKRKITAVVLFLAAFLALGTWTYHELKAGLPESSAVEAQSRRVEVAAKLLQHANDASVPVVQLLVTAERDKRIPLYKQIDQANAAAAADLQSLVALSASPEARLRIDILTGKQAQYDARYTAAVEEIERDGLQGALDQFWAGTRDALVGLVKATEGVVADERQKLADMQAAQATAQTASLRLLGAELLALLLAALAGSLAAGRRQ